jgi:cyclopropane-fatty-acyl-phospholipid synthase
MMQRSSPSNVATERDAYPVRAPSVAARMTRNLLRRMGNPAIALVLWTGESVTTCRSDSIGQLIIADPRTLARLFFDPEMEFGEAYSDGRIQVRGDLTRLMEEVNRGEAASAVSPMLRAPLRSLRMVYRYSSRSKSRDNIHHHYDISNDFYSLWLGQTMAYTCAYYPTTAATLDDAQTAKMELVCRKLRLRAGERVIEAGCGWGSLAIHMARRYGVKVTALNISREQLSFARKRAKAEGLSDRVDFVESDYRDIDRLGGSYDAFVSVGMLEHVNLRDYVDLGRRVSKCLNPSGRGLIHSIGRNRPTRLNAWIEKRIFPGAYAPCIGEMMRIFESSDHSVLDVENLRPHYARTLHDWRDRFNGHLEAIREQFDDRFVRMWELYLCGSEAAFNTGDLQLFQILFAPRASSFAPWTRADLYEPVDPDAKL